MNLRPAIMSPIAPDQVAWPRAWHTGGKAPSDVKRTHDMKTQVTEVAERIYRLSTYIPDAGPGGFTFNQFLIDADEPLLFHTGLRQMFPSVSAAIASVFHSNAYAGSRSGITKPTSAAR